ncbi:MAG: tetratricopeptide repeat protein [Leptolyngbyaceae cyanobacterium SL_1_1]|nr:tetratricopeptide repeat protein [Leptolyngbyaceae cyanobacterium SL_1_1]
MGSVLVACLTLLALPTWAIGSSDQSFFQLGVASLQAQQYSQAIAAFSQAVEQEPNHAAAYGNRCLAYLRTGQYVQAVADCTQAIERSSNHAEFYLNRGLANYRSGDYLAAINDYDRVLSLKTHDYRAFYNRGLAQFSLANYQAAIADYNQSLQKIPPLPAERVAAIYDDRGVAYLLLQNLAAAMPDFLEAIDHNPLDARAFFNLACVCHQQGKVPAAIAYFGQVLTIESDHAQSYFNRGMLYYQMSDKHSAIADLYQAAHCFYQQDNQVAYRKVIQVLTQVQTSQVTIG